MELACSSTPGASLMGTITQKLNLTLYFSGCLKSKQAV
jgi:hypothetical protein